MRRAVKCKNIIAFAVVLVLLISITAIPAYAEFPPLTTSGRRLGSWILSTLTAMNIVLTSSVSASQGADLINFLADPLDLTYSYTEMWDDRPTIQIWDDYTTIDGITYTDIWLSNEAASKFKTDGLDFATAYDIASNTNGTFVSGAGYYDGIPVFDDDGVLQTQFYTGIVPESVSVNTYSVGNGTLRAQRNSVNDNTGHIYYWNSNSQSSGTVGNGIGEPASLQLYKYSNTYWKARNPAGQYGNNLTNTLYVASPFDFDWVAGTIDAIPLEDDEGLMMRIPSNLMPDLPQFLTDNPEFNQPGGTTIDVNLDPDIMNKLDDLIDIIAPIIPVINNYGDVNFTVNHAEPTPPIPDTPIVDATVPQVVQPIINEIQNQGDIISQSIPPIIESIPKIDEICNNIDTAPYHDLDTGLDKLPTVFLPFITDLRSALGIWHYVTEWLGMIGTSFAFVSGCLAGTAIMTPIYAGIAGYMCIKVYRRMTG